MPDKYGHGPYSQVRARRVEELLDRLMIVEKYVLQGYRPASAILPHVNEELAKRGQQPIALQTLRSDLKRLDRRTSREKMLGLPELRRKHERGLDLVKEHLWRSHFEAGPNNPNKIAALNTLRQTELDQAKLDGSLVERVEQVVQVDMHAQARHLVGVLMEIHGGDSAIVERILSEWQKRVEADPAAVKKITDGK